MVSYFDLGKSFGLTDAVFDPKHLDPLPDIGVVGIRNPFGCGSTINVLSQVPALVAMWREEAAAQVRREEMETGWSDDLRISRKDFDLQLEHCVREHPLLRCDLTIYAPGVVYLRFELESGIALSLLPGVLTCFEYAAYRASVSEEFLACVLTHVRTAVHSSEQFVTLTSRPNYRVDKDSRGYEEWTLFRSFTGIITYTLPASQGDVPIELLEMFDIDPHDSDIDFEYHGHLHYSWATCVLQPRGSGEWTLEEELWRPLECIRIAHTALGTSEALLRLTDAEIDAQVRSYADPTVRHRDAIDLNRLRILGLAVDNLTNLRRITDTEEDQNYFERFTESGGLERSKAFLRQSLEVLYGVAQAEEQDEQDQKDAERTNREALLNVVVLVLAAITLISVSADAYLFVRESQPLLGSMGLRVLVLVVFVVCLMLLLFGLLKVASQSAKRAGRRGKVG